MFDSLSPQPPDKIIQLIQLFRDDPREQKIDLGVGVYRDASGTTPIMKAVKQAEKILLEQEITKTYTALAGAPEYHEAMIGLVLGDSVPIDRIAAAHTTGGSGAVRMAFEIARLSNPTSTVWIPKPSWPSHQSILNFIGMRSDGYSYFDFESKVTDFDQMMGDLQKAVRGDSIVLHGCCHNPTGADLNFQQWQELVEFIISKGLNPIIDLAYQGFGDGLEEDVRATRMVATKCPETLIAASCSKNFGIYRERTGILIASTQDTATQTKMQGILAHLNRQSISFPPDHGARIVSTILTDSELTQIWRDELTHIRHNLIAIRSSLSSELQKVTGSDRFGFLQSHKGMFSLLGCDSEHVLRMRDEHGVYLVGDGRINVAGLSQESIPYMAQAMVASGM
ncbi:MAG: aspartate/tyrosine/aromatic aminotransferase [Rhodobacteraceae bacterium]|nr:aspartate/tyrosine/aromatic aminotransferase [Paracoccaceae bacterium]